MQESERYLDLYLHLVTLYGLNQIIHVVNVDIVPIYRKKILK